MGTSKLLPEDDAEALAVLQEYKNAGLTVYMPQNAAPFGGYNGDDSKWATSEAKRVFDLCQQVDLKVLLQVDWLLEISDINKTPDDTFNSKYSDFNNTVKTRMSVYANHPAFYGVMLKDEPTSTESAKRFGIIYKAIKAAYPDCYVHYNLLPGMDNAYYQAFIDATEADYVMFDQYPMYESKGIYAQYIADVRRIAELCKSNSINLQVVTQATKKTDGDSWRNLDAADLYWLNNMLVGFGVDSIYYFTYYTPLNNDSETYADGYSFIKSDGSKTDTYTAIQQITAEMQLLAPVLYEYDYNASGIYVGAQGLIGSHKHYSAIDGSFVNITGVSVDNEGALVTELINEKGKYAYMIQNVADPDCTCSYNKAQTTTVTFAEGVSKITVYKNGVAEEVTLDGNTYTVTQTAGQAVYIVL